MIIINANFYDKSLCCDVTSIVIVKTSIIEMSIAV